MNGTVIRHENFPSQYVAARHVDVWLPPGYDAAESGCNVLYMHDGQNLFHEADAYAGVTWGIDAAMSQLRQAKAIAPTIVVGIWNAGDNRWREYMPQRPLMSKAQQRALAYLTAEYGGPPLADAYLRFLIEEVKPFIDQTYATRPEREHTYVMGSSMGGLISLYAVCEYPDHFTGAGCVSTHWPAVMGISVPYLATALPAPGRHRLYFDHGDRTLDAEYAPFQQQADRILNEAGYTPGVDWVTRYYAGAEHSERAWQKRVHVPLHFLLRE